MIHCQRCGGVTSERLVDGRMRPVCEGCGTPVYLDPKLAVAIVIVRGAAVLLGKRAGHTRNPGSWSFPAGFVERGERVEDAARREAREEIGVDVTVGPLLGIWSATGDSVALVAYAASVGEDATPRAGDDLLEVGWWLVSSLPPLAFAHDPDILAAALAEWTGCAG